jgi:ATP phosphoribosyltransferase regulatory subunit HisZ
MLTRRLSPEQAGVEVLGDRTVLGDWLAATPY